MTVAFLDLPFDQRPMAEVVAWLAERGARDGFAYVVTPNVDHMVRLATLSPPIRAAYEDANVILCDSRVLARLARWCGVRLPVVPGSDLCARLFADILLRGDRVCLIGGRPGVAEELGRRYPGLSIVQHRPPMGLREDATARGHAVAAAIASQARVTLFAVGSPQQEMLAHEMAAHPDACGTGLCIGAAVDFLSGAQRRAPRVFRQLGIEWSWRLLSDPRRLAKRYLVDGPVIFPLVWRWRRRHRGGA